MTILCLAAAYAQPEGSVSEMTDLRTATSKTWLNSDGTRTAEIHASPIHYKDIDGLWKDVDTSIIMSDLYSIENDPMPNPSMNFKFIYNLCAIFPQ